MLELIYEAATDIPSGFASLYTEKDGKWHLTGVNGMKSQGDIDRLQTALTKERTDHAAAKAALAPFTALGKTADELTALVDEEPTLRTQAAANGGKIDQAQIDQLVAAKVAPLERQITQLTATNAELTATNGELTGSIKNGKIKDALRAAGVELKVVDTAYDDVAMYGERIFDVLDDGSVVTKDGVGVTPGLDPKAWLTDQQKARPHWWPQSVGGGAGGGKGPGGVTNPWSKDGWNLTAQGAFTRTHGEEAARNMAKAVGSDIGQTRPPA